MTNTHSRPCQRPRCDCPHFERDADDADGCATCAHTKKSHQKVSGSSSRPDSDVDKPKKNPKSMTVMEIVSKRLAKSSPNDLTQADKEANRGLLAASSSVGKKKKRRPGASRLEKDEVKVGGVVFNPWGTETDTVDAVVTLLSSAAAVPSTTLPLYQSIGLAHTRPEGVMFDLTLTHQELGEWLNKSIPVFSCLFPDDSEVNDMELPNKWAICIVNRKALYYAAEEDPNARALFNKRSNPSKHWSEQFLYIVSLEPISGWDIHEHSPIVDEETFRAKFNQLLAQESRSDEFLPPRNEASSMTDSEIGSQSEEPEYPAMQGKLKRKRGDISDGDSDYDGSPAKLALPRKSPRFIHQTSIHSSKATSSRGSKRLSPALDSDDGSDIEVEAGIFSDSYTTVEEDMTVSGSVTDDPWCVHQIFQLPA